MARRSIILIRVKKNPTRRVLVDAMSKVTMDIPLPCGMGGQYNLAMDQWNKWLVLIEPTLEEIKRVVSTKDHVVYFQCKRTGYINICIFDMAHRDRITPALRNFIHTNAVGSKYQRCDVYKENLQLLIDNFSFHNDLDISNNVPIRLYKNCTPKWVINNST